MDLERLIECTRAIQAIPAPTFDEQNRAHFIRNKFEEAGLVDVHLDRIGNVLGRIEGGSKPRLIISAHLDTVFPATTELESKRTEDRLSGPGIGDNAIGLATLVELAHDLPGSPGGDIWFAATVGEEGLGNLRGMHEVVKRFEDLPTAYIVLEGMAFGHIYHRGLPVRRYEITTITEGGHAWIHAGRPSAIHILITVGAELMALALPTLPRTSLNIGRIDGGTSINSIANRASMKIDLRSEEIETLLDLESQVLELVNSHNNEQTEVHTTLIGERPGGGLPENHPLVQAAVHALKECGEKVIHLESGSTDASVPLSLDLPAICIGITRGGNAHSPSEYIEIKPISRGYNALLSTIRSAINDPSIFTVSR
jgi:acetylornithine deacetylase/succinyl-diaminopimelate desuccinylase-like protein